MGGLTASDLFRLTLSRRITFQAKQSGDKIAQDNYRRIQGVSPQIFLAFILRYYPTQVSKADTQQVVNVVVGLKDYTEFELTLRIE